MDKVTIEKGDIMKALLDIVQNDESIDRLVTKIPVLGLVFGMIAIKMEERFFSEDAPVEGEGN